MELTVVKVEVVGDNIDIGYSDGSRERIEFGVYELRDADGKRIERHRATDEDVARLQAVVDAFGGDTTSDDGTPDQGPGDAPGTDGSDDGALAGDDDGTPDQGPGDAPGTVGADDGTGSGDDDGTPDQGPGDAPGTVGADDGTPDQGPGDAPGTDGADDGAVAGDDDGTPDQGSGDVAVATVVGAAAPLASLTGSDGSDRIRGTNAAEQIDGLGGNDRIEGRGGNDVLDGGAGDDEVRGDGGADVVAGGAGNDDLWGGKGADSFVFADGGQDKIHDFQNGIDRIDVSAYGFADGAAVLANAWEEGGDSFIDLGGGSLIKIDDVSITQLDATDFII